MRNQQNFTACGHEVDNKSFGIGMVAMAVVTATGIALFKGGKWAFGKVGGYLAEKKAKKQENVQKAQVKEEGK